MNDKPSRAPKRNRDTEAGCGSPTQPLEKKRPGTKHGHVCNTNVDKDMAFGITPCTECKRITMHRCLPAGKIPPELWAMISCFVPEIARLFVRQGVLAFDDLTHYAFGDDETFRLVELMPNLAWVKLCFFPIMKEPFMATKVRTLVVDWTLDPLGYPPIETTTMDGLHNFNRVESIVILSGVPRYLFDHPAGMLHPDLYNTLSRLELHRYDPVKPGAVVRGGSYLAHSVKVHLFNPARVLVTHPTATLNMSI